MITIAMDNDDHDATGNDNDVDSNGATADDINDSDCDGVMNGDYGNDDRGAMDSDETKATTMTLMAMVRWMRTTTTTTTIVMDDNVDGNDGNNNNDCDG